VTSLTSAARYAASLIVTLALLGLPLGATTANATTLAPGPTTGGTIPPTVVHATLTEMAFTLDRYSVAPGWVNFLVTNSGKIVHELVVLKTDLPIDQLPANPDEPGKVVEDVHMGEVGDIDPGRFSGTTMLLGPGRYLIICNEPGHYAAGMRVEFRVVQPTVNVTLTDNMTIGVDQPAVFEGPLLFGVTNTGKIVHEFVIFQTDLTADQIPADPTEPGKVDETWNIGETGDVAPGRFTGLAITLAPGHYLLVCNEPGHFAAGMHLDFTVLPAPHGDE
jgi:uncharacterized cupredoxin-like copper-binding protein